MHEALVADLSRRARAASDRLAELATDVKDTALRRAADALVAASDEILRANAKDLEAGRERGLAGPLLERLTLDAKRIAGIAEERGLSFEEMAPIYRKELGQNTDFITPERVSGVIAFLCTDAAKDINGVSIPIDGGLANTWMQQGLD